MQEVLMNSMNTKRPGFQWLYVRGEIGFDSATESDVLLDHLADCLRRVSAKDVVITNLTIDFTGGVRRWVTTANSLVNFDRGTLTVDCANKTVTYRLRFYEATACSLIIGAVFALFVGWNTEELIYPWLTGTAGLWIFMGNRVLGPMKFRSFLIAAIGSAPRRAKAGTEATSLPREARHQGPTCKGLGVD